MPGIPPSAFAEVVNQLRGSLPDAGITVSEPRHTDGAWVADIKLDGRWLNFGFVPGKGAGIGRFGVSLVTDDTGYGEGADAVFRGDRVEPVVAHALWLLRSSSNKPVEEKPLFVAEPPVVGSAEHFQQILDSVSPLNVVLAYGSGERPDEQTGDCEEAAAVFAFAEKGFGFGEITVVQRGGKMFVDTECMSREKVKFYLNAMIDQAVCDIDDEPEKHRAYSEATGRSCGPGCTVCESVEVKDAEIV